VPKRFRRTRRFSGAVTQDGYRGLKRFAAQADLVEGEALPFLCENFDSVTDTDLPGHRLRLFHPELEARKRWDRAARQKACGGAVRLRGLGQQEGRATRGTWRPPGALNIGRRMGGGRVPRWRGVTVSRWSGRRTRSGTKDRGFHTPGPPWSLGAR
jgi:hypothetical protein